jgi:hypothetical protein
VKEKTSWNRVRRKKKMECVVVKQNLGLQKKENDTKQESKFNHRISQESKFNRRATKESKINHRRNQESKFNRRPN